MKKANIEFKESKKVEGYTMRANVNPDLIKALKRWNKEDGKAIAEAIQSGNVKKAIYYMQNAKNRNLEIRQISEHHNKIIYLNGKEWGSFDYIERKCYKFE